MPQRNHLETEGKAVIDTLVGGGKTQKGLYKEIAEKLGISTKTVDNTKTNIFHKLSVNSTTEVVIYAFRNGLVDIEHDATSFSAFQLFLYSRYVVPVSE